MTLLSNLSWSLPSPPPICSQYLIYIIQYINVGLDSWPPIEYMTLGGHSFILFLHSAKHTCIPLGHLSVALGSNPCVRLIQLQYHNFCRRAHNNNHYRTYCTKVWRINKHISIQVWQIYDSEYYFSKITLLMHTRANKNSQIYSEYCTVFRRGKNMVSSPSDEEVDGAPCTFTM